MTKILKAVSLPQTWKVMRLFLAKIRNALMTEKKRTSRLLGGPHLKQTNKQKQNETKKTPPLS